MTVKGEQDDAVAFRVFFVVTILEDCFIIRDHEICCRR